MDCMDTASAEVVGADAAAVVLVFEDAASVVILCEDVDVACVVVVCEDNVDIVVCGGAASVPCAAGLGSREAVVLDGRVVVLELFAISHVLLKASIAARIISVSQRLMDVKPVPRTHQLYLVCRRHSECTTALSVHR